MVQRKRVERPDDDAGEQTLTVGCVDAASLPDGDPRLEVPCHDYIAVASRWKVSPWTVRDYVRRGWLERPTYLSAIKPRFSESQLRQFERSRPSEWAEPKVSKPRKRDGKGRYRV